MSKHSDGQRVSAVPFRTVSITHHHKEMGVFFRGGTLKTPLCAGRISNFVRRIRQSTSDPLASLLVLDRRMFVLGPRREATTR